MVKKERSKCIYLDFEVDEILFLQNLLNGTTYKTYILNDVMFQKKGEDQYHILEETDIPNTEEGKASIEVGFEYRHYSRWGLPFFFAGYGTNRLGLDHLVTALKDKVGVDGETGKSLVQGSLF